MLPLIPFGKHFLDTTIRHSVVQSIGNNTQAYQALSPKILLSGVFGNLRNVFSQVRVRRVDLYIIPALGLTARGYHLVHLAPKREFAYVPGLDFKIAAGWPGSKVDRIFESLAVSWYPTDSTEKVWFSTKASEALVDYFYISSCQLMNEEKSDIQIVVDCHVTLRGVQKITRSLVCKHCGGCMDDEDLAT